MMNFKICVKIIRCKLMEIFNVFRINLFNQNQLFEFVK